MRKILAVGLILVMVVIGFAAMLNPVASDGCGCVTVCKSATPTCRYGGYPVGLWDNDHVPLNTFVAWELTIVVKNTHAYAIEDVWVKDRLGAELKYLGTIWISQGSATFDTKGGSDKVFIEWDVGTIPGGKSATLIIGIGTDLNPAGKQEYTSPGCYYLNSGATAKWFVDGKQYSATSNRILIHVIGEEEE